jgi:ubiquinone/menaquinone biosynthesis C-methylase UbiE
MTDVKKWYDNSYKEDGFNAQRRYPNEELLRFLGGNFFNKTEIKDRKSIKVLEVGCGSCANLWMIAKEGFDTYGLDLSEEALMLGKKMLDSWQTEANLQQGSFTNLPYEDSSFDVVVDVLAMSCVDHESYLTGIDEIYRVLKKNGLFFSYTPNQNSDSFKNYKPAVKIDNWTLNGLYREDGFGAGNHYPFHFWDKGSLKEVLINTGFKINVLESLTRSYKGGEEVFESYLFHAQKK